MKRKTTRTRTRRCHRVRRCRKTIRNPYGRGRPRGRGRPKTRKSLFGGRVRATSLNPHPKKTREFDLSWMEIPKSKSRKR